MGTYANDWWMHSGGGCNYTNLVEALQGAILTDLLPIKTEEQETVAGIVSTSNTSRNSIACCQRSSWFSLDNRAVSVRVWLETRRGVFQIPRIYVRWYMGGCSSYRTRGRQDNTSPSQSDHVGFQIQGRILGRTFSRSSEKHQLRRCHGQYEATIIQIRSSISLSSLYLKDRVCIIFQGLVRFYDNERKAYILLKQFQSEYETRRCR